MWMGIAFQCISASNPQQTVQTQIARFMGPTWGPPGSCRPQADPMSATLTLLSGEYLKHNKFEKQTIPITDCDAGDMVSVLFTQHPKGYVCTLSMLSGPLFTKRTDILPQDLAKSRCQEIQVSTFLIAVKFESSDNAASEMPVKFQNDAIV